MDVINYKGGKALLIDSNDLLAMDSRSRDAILRTREIVKTIDTMRHEGIETLLIVTSFQLRRVPKILRHILLGENDGVSFNILNCYRVAIGGKE